MNLEMLTVALLVVGAFVGGGLLSLQLAQRRPSAAPAPPGPPASGPARHVSVGGVGTVQSPPDRARLQLGVQSEAPTAQAALALNSRQMQALVTRLRELGIADRDLQTSQLHINARYQYETRTFAGYEVTNTLFVVIREIARAGDLLDQVVAAGANQISGISFEISDPAALESQARQLAIADARARASQLLAPLELQPGRVLTVRENAGDYQPVYGKHDASRMMMAEAAPIEAGEQAVSVTVEVTFEIADRA